MTIMKIHSAQYVIYFRFINLKPYYLKIIIGLKEIDYTLYIYWLWYTYSKKFKKQKIKKKTGESKQFLPILKFLVQDRDSKFTERKGSAGSFYFIIIIIPFRFEQGSKLSNHIPMYFLNWNELKILPIGKNYKFSNTIL